MPDSPGDWTPGPSFTHSSGLRLSGQLPLEVLPAEALERLQAGGALTDAELDAVRRAALAESGVGGALVNSLLDSAGVGRLTTQRTPSGAIITEGERTFTWTPDREFPEPPRVDAQTYYELLSGRPDPQRGSFVGARGLLNMVSWAFAIGIPVLLVAAGMWSGASGETIFFIGVFGLIIAAMIRKSMPGSPFG